MTCEQARASLRELLLGPPLAARDDDDTRAQLDAWMRAIEGLLPQLYGVQEPARQARMEFERFANLPGTHEGLMCKRAALLFALLHEKEIGMAMGGDDACARDMRARVLPFTCPHFLRHSCQTPDTFVVLSAVLHEMWGGEQLGNWPLERARTTT